MSILSFFGRVTSIVKKKPAVVKMYEESDDRYEFIHHKGSSDIWVRCKYCLVEARLDDSELKNHGLPMKNIRIIECLDHEIYCDPHKNTISSHCDIDKFTFKVSFPDRPTLKAMMDIEPWSHWIEDSKGNGYCEGKNGGFIRFPSREFHKMFSPYNLY